MSSITNMNTNSINNDSYCIYIPCVEPSTVPEFIAYHCKCIGNVVRVDFVPRNKPARDLFYTDENIVCSAFVYFAGMNYPFLGRQVVNTLESGNSFRLRLPNNKFWILLKSTSQFKSTLMNNHQIVEGCRIMQTQVEEQEKRINYLEVANELLLETIQEQNDKIQLIYAAFYNQFPANEDQEDQETHDSMPSLAECDTIVSSFSDEDSAIITLSVIPVLDRIRNTEELCGNN